MHARAISRCPAQPGGNAPQRRASHPAARSPRSCVPQRPRRRVAVLAAAGGGDGGGGSSGNEQTASAGQCTVEYKDSLTDIAFIGLCRIAYGNIAGWQSSRSWTDGPETFRGMVEVSRTLMRGRTAAEQRDAVIAGFPEVPAWFRKLFPYSKWGAEVNARITPAFFTWLVGPMKTAPAEVDGQQQMSAVKIERCRYLAESGCAAMCVNLCKAPVQKFFTEELGMRLTMKPNFEDYSCEMVFGEQPTPLEEDPVHNQPCLAACATAITEGQKCHKLI